MLDKELTTFRRKIIGERILLMLPLNVVLAGRVRGAVDPPEVMAALKRLRSRHPLLAVRADIGEDGSGAYVRSNVPALQVHVVPRDSEDQWLELVEEELRIPFALRRDRS